MIFRQFSKLIYGTNDLFSNVKFLKEAYRPSYCKIKFRSLSLPAMSNANSLDTKVVTEKENSEVTENNIKMEKENSNVGESHMEKMAEATHNSVSLKREGEPNEHEKYVKRIQLDPKPCLEDRGEEPAGSRKMKKYVLLMSYSGKGYLGMQRNPGCHTIEEDLFKAMLNAGLVTEEFCTCPQILRFQRAARTDKGVSAARQIVSVKLPSGDNLPSQINKFLPDQIRVMKAIKVTKHFDAKSQCDNRSYSYLTPSFAFAPVDQPTTEDYRLSEKMLGEIREILGQYKGTKNYHNFTCRVKFTESCAKRYIIDISCSDPFIREGLEWVLIRVKGQSFMMHQIRKMVGLCIAACRGMVDKSVFDKVYTSERCDIPITPGLGLVLEEPHYDYYNKKFGNDGLHEAISWTDVTEDVEAFREEYVNKDIVATEKEEKVTFKWLSTLPLHFFLNGNQVESEATGDSSDQNVEIKPSAESSIQSIEIKPSAESANGITPHSTAPEEKGEESGAPSEPIDISSESELLSSVSNKSS